MAGETDLGAILRTLTVERREGTYVYATVPAGRSLPDVPLSAMVAEVEGTTIVVDRDVAVGAGVDFEYEAAWLTVTAHTSLEAVGLTASISTAFAMRDLPCNIIAGYHHDHLLVPLARVEDAVAAIELVRRQSGA